MKMSAALPKTVFIVDDSIHIVDALTTMLSELERINVVGFAREAAEASFYIRRLQPDIVILDIQLQRGTGIDVLETMKKKQPSPVAIMLTNYPTGPYRTKCQSLGADYFFDKSSEFEKVADVCQSLAHWIRFKFWKQNEFIKSCVRESFLSWLFPFPEMRAIHNTQDKSLWIAGWVYPRRFSLLPTRSSCKRFTLIINTSSSDGFTLSGSSGRNFRFFTQKFSSVFLYWIFLRWIGIQWKKIILLLQWFPLHNGEWIMKDTVSEYVAHSIWRYSPLISSDEPLTTEIFSL